MNRQRTARVRRVIFEQLERRVLLSADSVVDALEDRSLDAGSVSDSPYTDGLRPAASGTFDPLADSQTSEPDGVYRRTEIYFIDSRVPDALTLIEDFQDRGQRGIEIVLLDARQSGIDQVSDTLAEFRDLDAVHIVSHATQGAVQFGSTALDLAALEDQSEAIRGWGESFAERGDLLFYGCDLAAGTGGETLVNRLAALTGTDVAASMDPTGSAEKGGDWELEYHNGTVETPVGFDLSTRDAFSGILAPNVPPTVSATPTDPAYTEGGMAADPFDAVSIDAVEAAQNIDEIVLTVSNVTDGANEILNIDGTVVTLTDTNSGSTTTNSYGYAVSLSGNTATVALTTTGATPAAAETVVDTLSYQNNGSPPTVADRVVTLVSVKDSGGIVGGGNDTATTNIASTVRVTAKGPALWLSTDSNVGAPGADGLPSGWTEGQVLEFGGPDLTHGAATDGDLSMVMDFDTFTLDPVDAGALHFVSRDITVGSGANTFDLKSGDVLVSFLQDETILASYTSSGSNEFYSDGDLLVFRPTSFDDYSTGTFHLLLDEVVTDDLKGVTLVEQDTTIGLTPISAGSFLIIQETSTTTSIDLFEPTGVGAGATTGTTTPLIDLSNLGIDANRLRGIELIESATSVGGQLLSAGSLLATLNVDDNVSGVGSNNLLVDMQDVFVLNLTATGLGTTTGTAAMVLDGGLVHLDGTGGAESAYGLALKSYSQLRVDTTSDVSDGDTSSLVALLHNKGADGKISLREAIEAANATPNGDIDDTITFDITDPLVDGAHRINLTPALPTITDTVAIDGWSEPDHTGNPVIRIDGGGAGPNVDGLSLSATADGSVIRGLMITDFSRDGILVQSGADDVTITGNWIGTSGTGSTGVGNSDDGIDLRGANATIGGAGANDGNVVTNSGDEGIDIVGSGVTGHVIQGNYIGLDPDGSTGLGNSDVGIAIISGSGNIVGGTSAAARNVISNNYEGMEINTDDNVVQGNYVGTDAGGTLDRGNRSDDGVEIQSGATGNLVGGTAAGAGNLIAFNALAGVNVFSGIGNTVLGNEVHSNSGLGINLGTGGITPNDTDPDPAPDDVDSGANDLQNFPVITTAELSGTDLTLSGSLDTDGITKQYRIEFFGNAAGTQDTSNGEGRYYLGATPVTTDGSGDATFSNVTLSGVTLGVGDYVTATATFIDDPAQVGIDDSLAYASTSEFAANVPIVDGNTTPTTSGIADFSVNEDVGFAYINLYAVFADAEDADSALVYSIESNTNPSLFDSTAINGSGVLALDYAADQNGVADIIVRATDTGGLFVETTFTVTVNPVNDAPIARPDGVNLLFDGSDFVQVADAPSLQMTNTVTMEAWINHSGSGTGSQLILNKEGEYELGITADTGEIKFAIADAGGTWNWHNTGYFITAGEWTHVAVTYDGVAGEAKTYINGELVDTHAQAGVIGDVYPGFNDLFVGGRENASTQRFQGQIDEVRVWDTSRTQGEIQTYMSGSLTGGEAGLAGNWRLDEAAGGAVVDQSPFGNDGVLGGGEGAAAMPAYQGYVTDENTLLTVPAGSGVLANDLDIDSGSLTVTNLDTTGMLGSVVLNSADGSFTYDPRGVFEQLAHGEQVTETFTYTANDGSSDSNTVTVSITVTGVNDAPVNSIPPAQNTNEDTALVFSTGNGNLISVGDVDAGSSPLRVTLTATNGTLSLSRTDGLSFSTGTGTGDTTMVFSGTTTNLNTALDGLSFLPYSDYAGAANIEIQTADLGSEVIGNDTVYGSSTTAGDFDKEQISTKIIIAENGTLNSITAYLYMDKVDNVRFGLYADAAGEPGALLVESNSVSVAAGTNWYTIDLPTTVISAGDYWLAMDIGKEGAYFFDAAGGDTRHSNYDPNGGLADPWSGTYQSNTRSISVYANVTPDSATPKTDIDNVGITVTPVNDVPAAAADSYSAAEDTAVTTGNVLSNDNLGDMPTTITASDATSTNGGVVVNEGDGTFTYTPAPNFNGSDSFIYTITDLDGETSTATVTITVTAVNDVPAAVADGTSTAEGTAVTTGNVLTNDELGDEPTTITAFDATSVNGGTVVDNGDGTFTYTPAGNFNGSDSFTYTITDLDGETSSATVTITVSAVNDVPTAVADSYSTAEDTAVTTGNVLTNDDLGDEPTTIAAFDALSANGGTVVNNGDGTFTYVPATNFSSSDSFTYTITELNGETSTTTVTISVTPVNDTPLAAADSYGTAQGTAVATGNVLTNDIWGDEPAIIAVFDSTSVNGGTVVNNGDGTFTYTPPANFNGSDSFTYTITDLDGETSTATVTISVTPTSASDNGTPTVQTRIPNVERPADSDGVSPPEGGYAASDESDDEGEKELLPNSDSFSTRQSGAGSTSPKEEDAAAENTETNETALPADAVEITDQAGTGQTTEEVPGSAYSVGPHVAEPPYPLDVQRNGPSGSVSGYTAPLMASPEFLNALDQVRVDLSEGGALDESRLEILVGGTMATGISLTAGFVTWAIRGGSLLTTLVASVPVWKGFDPLPIVMGSRRLRKERERDEEVEDSSGVVADDARVARLLDAKEPAESSKRKGDAT